MSKVNRFPIEGKLLNQLVAIIGKKNADKVARVCRSADFIASCKSAREVGDFLGNDLTNPKEREDVATKALQWANSIFGVHQDITPLTRDDAVIVATEAYADAVTQAFDNWEQVFAFPSEEEVATLFANAITDEETRKRIADRLYRCAQRMLSVVQPSTAGGVSIGSGSQVSIGGDAVGGNKYGS